MDTSEIIGPARDLLTRERPREAFDLIAPALVRDPDNIELLLVMAETLTDLDRPAEATAAYRGILAIDPEHPEALARVKEATAAMETLLRLASISDDLRAWEEARENYEAVLYQDPHSLIALDRLLALDGAEGRLRDADRHHAALVSALGATDVSQLHPNLLAMIAYQAILRPLPRPLLDAVTAALARRNMELAEDFGPLPAPLPKANGRLRIGYLSGSLRDHPIGHVTCGLFAAHDRSKVEVHIFSWPTGEANAYTDKIRAGAEHFHTADDAVTMVRAIARQNLDMLIYIDGYMSPFLLPVIARRPAPIQVYWLGHAGSCESAGIDYFLADETVVPPGDERLYRADVLRLPGTYHPASPHDVGPPMSRTEAGLPENGFVFCAFNAPEKIDTPTFEMWMRILHRVPESLLWLSRTQSSEIGANLRREAESRGIAGERLIFADRLPSKAAHLARHGQAGLFLDTLGLNASTTAIDALWAGLPLLTVRGNRFASRIAATLLTAVGLSDLVCATPAELEDRAVALAMHPSALAEVRTRLAANRKDHPLFQIEAFCRKLETTLIALHAKARR